MIRYFFNKMLLSMQRRYDYDVSYLQDILNADMRAFLKFMGFQTMSSHSGKLAAAPLFAARLRSIIREDCGPCTQLLVDMALEADVSPDIVRAIVHKEYEKLPADVALVVQFSEYVLSHDPRADELREKVVSLWGTEGLVAIGFGISSSRVYPSLKYTLGHGKTCQRVNINDVSLTMGINHV